MSDPIALDSLTRDLRVCYRFDPPKGYRRGKAQIQSLVMTMLACSPRRAERLVAAMESAGFIDVHRLCRSGRDGSDRSDGEVRWHFNPYPT